MIDDLKNLKKIEAPVGFEQKLWNKINSSDAQQKQSLLTKLSTRLIPAFAVAATAILLFVVIENSANEYQDPFMIEPEERTDLISFSTDDIQLLESEPSAVKEKPQVQTDEKSSVRFRKKEAPAPVLLSNESQIAGRTETVETEAEDSVAPDSPILSASAKDEVVGNEGLMAPAASTQMQQNLNFRQIQLSKEEQQEIIELKSKTLKATQSKEK
ncbi:MAG TPA: hypothetical protein VK870_03870 [Ignavibacteriaceae bacterium]|nr:hypothetical protein [Ignavibacteriaceae bacterium]